VPLWSLAGAGDPLLSFCNTLFFVFMLFLYEVLMSAVVCPDALIDTGSQQARRSDLYSCANHGALKPLRPCVNALRRAATFCSRATRRRGASRPRNKKCVHHVTREDQAELSLSRGRYAVRLTWYRSRIGPFLTSDLAPRSAMFSGQ
jgi:hypothetical protein